MTVRLSPHNWSIADLETATEKEQRRFWRALELTFTEEEGVVAAHLRTGQPAYTRERTTPAGLVIKTHGTDV